MLGKSRAVGLVINQGAPLRVHRVAARHLYLEASAKWLRGLGEARYACPHLDRIDFAGARAVMEQRDLVAALIRQLLLLESMGTVGPARARP